MIWVWRRNLEVYQMKLLSLLQQKEIVFFQNWIILITINFE